MRERTKLRLRFYFSLIGIVGYTLAVGLLFSWLVNMSWKMKMGFLPEKYSLFWILAAILFVMTIVDIVLFFRIIIQRRYW